MNEVNFADIDPASIESSVLSTYEQIAQTTLYPGDPVRLFLEALAYTLAVQNNIINLAGRQNLLFYAEAAHLDHIGLMVGCTRLSESPARCVQAFYLAAPLDFAVLIPAGTRVTTRTGGSRPPQSPPVRNGQSPYASSGDGMAVFATKDSISINPGEVSGLVEVVCTEPGADFNGLVAGQINKMIDPVAYVTATENISVTSFGADVESDERFRARIQLAPEAYSNAGSYGAYRYHALSAHQDIAEVSVWRPRPGDVDVRPVLKNGELPGAELLELVAEKLSADTVRPLNDTVIVAAPEPVEYEIAVSWALNRNDAALAALITARVEAAVENYRLWQRSAPGRDINPTKLISLMEQAGARRVEVKSPVFVEIEPKKIARETGVQINFLGIENE